MTPPVVIVLAGGGSRRFGTADKLLAEVDGAPLLAHTLEAVTGHGADVLAIVDDEHGDRAQLALAVGAEVVVAPDAALGMRHSLAAGFAAAADRSAPGVVVVLGDDPLAAAALGRVLEAAARAPHATIAVRRATGAPHPVHVPQVRWELLAGASHDAGLRQLLGPDVTWLDVPGAESLDVDAPADLARLERRLSRARRMPR